MMQHRVFEEVVGRLLFSITFDLIFATEVSTVLLLVFAILWLVCLVKRSLEVEVPSVSHRLMLTMQVVESRIDMV